jgi:hypothetical protein
MSMCLLCKSGIWEKLRVFVKRFVKIIDNGYSTVILRVDMDDRLEDIRRDMDY